jgi:hypothetical protein
MITLTEPTPTIIPTFNRVLYKIVSDNASQIGFKYVVKIYNSNNELITTAYYDTPPNPALEVEFDISKFISTYYDFSNGFTQSGNVTDNGGIVFPFYIKCYEYYAVAGVYQIVTASEVISATKYGFAAALPLLELREFYTDYTLYNGSSNTIYKPLTDWTSIKCRAADSQIISFINNGKITNIELVVTNTTGGVTTHFITSTTPTGHTITQFKITPMTYGSVDNIQVYINWNNGAARRYKVCDIYIQSCGKYEPMRLAYLNKYGAYDFFNFDLINRTSYNIDRKNYQREYTGDIYSNGSNIVKSINNTYYTKETQRWKLISDYLNDEQSVMIRELYSSPVVYGYIVNEASIVPSWIPLKPLATSYELKTIINDKLFNLELDLEYDIINTRQSI